MDAERLAFLYGEGIAADEWDLDDVEVRAQILERSFSGELTTVGLFGTRDHRKPDLRR